MLNDLKRSIPNIYSPALLLILWEILSRTGVFNPVFLPPPSVIMLTIFKFAKSGMLVRDVGISLFRILSGLIIGGIPALVLGILMGRSRFWYYFLHPLVSLTYPIPKIAIIPFIILIFGIGELSKIILVALGAFFLIFLNTYHGVSNIDKRYFDVAKIFSYTTLDRWLYIILPGAMPSIFHGIRLAIGMCFILVVAAEFIGGSSGIGYRIWTSWEAFDITGMFAALIVLSVLGGAFNTLIEQVERWTMPWKTA